MVSKHCPDVHALPLLYPLAPGAGFCYPAYAHPDVALPRASCPEGFEMEAPGKCIKKATMTGQACYVGPKCLAPFNQTGNATCWDDKVMQVGVRGAWRGSARALHGRTKERGCDGV